MQTSSEQTFMNLTGLSENPKKCEMYIRFVLFQKLVRD